MTIKELYRKYLLELQKIYTPGEAASITAIIFQHFGGLSRSDIIMEPGTKPAEKLVGLLNSSLDKLLIHTPVQYITGETEFCGLTLKVSPAVLIPRPETEELVRAALQLLGTKEAVLDIGTGSGCIPVAIKFKNQDAVITALDISHAAVSVARENAQDHNTQIEFIVMDFLDEDNWSQLGMYDLLTSNPPYIPWSELPSMQKNVTEFEPGVALFVDNDMPIVFYEKLAAFGKQHLREGGKILVETHERFANQVLSHFNDNGYHGKTMKDLHGKDRMVLAWQK